MKAWVTKHALSRRIMVYDTDDGCARILGDQNTLEVGSYGARFYKSCGQWHDNEADAVKKAEEMRLEKIAFYERRLTAMKKKKFEVTG